MLHPVRLLVYLVSMPFVQVRQSLPMPSTSAAVPAGAAPASDEVPQILSEVVERESSHTVVHCSSEVIDFAW